MTDEQNPTRRSPRHETPVPTADLVKVTESVIRIEESLKSIKIDLLPPVIQESSEARDGVLRLEGRVSVLEAAPHECIEAERLSFHDRIVSGLEKEIGSISRWKWWILGTILTIGMASVAVVVGTMRDVSVISTEMRTNQRDLNVYKERIDAVELRTQDERSAIIRELRNISIKLDMRSQRDLEERIKALPLPALEKEKLYDMLDMSRRGKNAD